MTITIDLLDELASQLTARLQDSDARLAASLVADIDPEREPEREAAECIAIVEEGLEDVDAGRNLISFEEARRQWEAEKTARRAADRK